MKNVIVGTAGHVDHGKTCLIKALTGTDTDRLKEEKKRGITIELGFTNMPVDADMKVGIIDVPGHEKFVKNMLAGIGGIDLVLLVVGLDEGVMPQTVEHFEVLKMLNIQKGIVVLTKADLVDADWAELVKADVEDLIEGTFMEGAKTIEVSSYTGQNIEELKKLIVEEVSDTKQRTNEPKLFRLPIDRVFIMEGFGTVITGTLLEGSVSVGDEVILFPTGERVKIRGIQVQSETVETAYAGQRTAINISNMKKEDIDRGFVLAAEGCMELSKFVDVRIKLFPSTKRTLKNGDRVHINYGAAQVLTKVVLLDKDYISAGESALAQLRFDEPVAVKKGDNFIIRFYSPVETFGGGEVLEAVAHKHKKDNPQVIEDLLIKETGDLEEVLAVMVKEDSYSFPTAAHFATKLGILEKEADAILSGLTEKGIIFATSEKGYYHKVMRERFEAFANELLGEFHKANPIAPGMAKEEFKSRLNDFMHFNDMKSAEIVMGELVAGKVLGTNQATIALSSFEAKYTKEFSKVRERIEQIYKAAGFEMPALEDALAEFKDKKAANLIVEDLVKTEVLVKVNHPYYMDKEYWDKAVDFLKQYLETHETIALGDYRDGLNTSRKYAVLLLEAFDKRKITIKVGDERKLK